MPLFSNSIAAKLIAIVVGVVVLTITLTTAGSVNRELRNFNDFYKGELRATAQILSSSVATPLANGDINAVNATLTAIARLDNILLVQVRDVARKPVAEMGQAVILPERNLTADTPTGLFTLLGTDTLSATVTVIKSGEATGTLTVFRDVSAIRRELIQLVVNAVLLALLASTIGIACAWLLQRRIIRPVKDLATIMAEVQSTDDFTLTAERTTGDEVGRLVDAFNEMLGNIRARDDKLADHRRNLEKTVEKRTRQYRKARDVAVRANAAKSDFLATMSHEIRTPMNGIMVMAELLSAAELSLRHQRYASVIVNSGQSLLSIINDILDLSKIEAGKMDLELIECDPSAIAGDVLNLFSEKAASKKIGLAAYVAPDVPRTVLADPVRLNQILSNLVNNAIKFTEEGHVLISLTRSAADGDVLTFAVTDTGIGIPEDKQARVFEAFSQADQSTTRQFGGTGLGLSICQRLVTAMGGRIGVTSEEGRGSCFFFSTLTPEALGESKATDPVSLEGRTVAALLIRDSDDTSWSLARTLQDHAAQLTSGVEDLSHADFVIGDAEAMALLPGDLAAGGRVCLAGLGDTLPEQLLEKGLVQDLLFAPVQPAELAGLVARMDTGTLRGKTALRGTARQQDSAHDFSGCRALVADDSAVNREVIIEAMNTLKVSTVTVENGREAVDVVGREDFDIIFMDCSMPEMDGYEATRHIREFEKKTGRDATPVVALTAQMAGMSGDAWQQAGMNELMTKPFKLETLARVIGRYAGSAGTDVKAAEAAAPALDPAALNEPEIAAADDWLDQQTLADLREMGAGSGKDLAARALMIFAEAAPGALKRIVAAIKAEDMAELASAAHSFKSMSYNAGALKLGKSCAAVEAAAAAGRFLPADAGPMLIACEGTLQEIAAR